MGRCRGIPKLGPDVGPMSRSDSGLNGEQAATPPPHGQNALGAIRCWALVVLPAPPQPACPSPGERGRAHLAAWKFDLLYCAVLASDAKLQGYETEQPQQAR